MSDIPIGRIKPALPKVSVCQVVKGDGTDGNRRRVFVGRDESPDSHVVQPFRLLEEQRVTELDGHSVVHDGHVEEDARRINGDEIGAAVVVARTYRDGPVEDVIVMSRRQQCARHSNDAEVRGPLRT